MYFATLISRIFEPMVVISVTTLIIAIVAGLSTLQLQLFIIVLFFFMVLPAALVRYWLLKKKFVSDWDIRKRSQRLAPLLLLTGFTTLNLWVVSLFGNMILNSLFSAYVLWIIGFLCITLFWKMSGHVSIVTLGVLLLLHWIGWWAWPILLFIPLIAWSRVKTKNHTVAQVAVGAFYSIALVKILGY